MRSTKITNSIVSMQVTFVNKVSYLCLCVHACAHAFSELFGFQTYRKETCCRRGKKEILPTKINKLVFTFTQWKLKNNDKPKHPKYTQHYSICIKFLNTHNYKKSRIHKICDLYIYIYIYIYIKFYIYIMWMQSEKGTLLIEWIIS